MNLSLTDIVCRILHCLIFNNWWNVLGTVFVSFRNHPRKLFNDKNRSYEKLLLEMRIKGPTKAGRLGALTPPSKTCHALA